MPNLRKGILCAAVALFAVCLLMLTFVWGTEAGRTRENDLWAPRLQQWQTDNAALQAENDALKAAADTAKSAPASDDPAITALLDDLAQQTTLIPVQPQLGGTMRIFADLSRLLGDRYAYAYAEDGHVAVDMIFRYRQNEDASVNWQLTMFDAGNGWEAA